MQIHAIIHTNERAPQLLLAEDVDLVVVVFFPFHIYGYPVWILISPTFYFPTITLYPSLITSSSVSLSNDRFLQSSTKMTTMNDDRPLQPTSDGGPYEKDFSNGYGNMSGHQHLDETHDTGAALNRIRTAGSISISPELFEKLYLSPENKVSGDLRKTFGNPTPM